jgi:hypothetical protein
VVLAEAFDVATDYLLVDGTARRPFRRGDEALGTRLSQVSELGEEDLTLVLSFIDALVTRTRLKALAGGLS